MEFSMILSNIFFVINTRWVSQDPRRTATPWASWTAEAWASPSPPWTHRGWRCWSRRPRQSLSCWRVPRAGCSWLGPSKVTRTARSSTTVVAPADDDEVQHADRRQQTRRSSSCRATGERCRPELTRRARKPVARVSTASLLCYTCLFMTRILKNTISYVRSLYDNHSRQYS